MTLVPRRDDAPRAAPAAPAGPSVPWRVVAAARRYPFVLATILVGAVGLVFLVLGWPWAEWVPATAAVTMAIRSSLRMIRDLRSGSVGVDVLAITAIIVAVTVGEVWAALVIVLMLTGGEALEDYAASRAKRDLSALVADAPRTAHRIDRDGTLTDVPVEAIRPGDELLVRSHEIVPVDGVLVGGTGVFDESTLTGESVPVERVAGDEVLSGGINGPAPVRIRAIRTAEASQYHQIVALVEAASASRSPLVRLADRFAIPYTLLSLGLAVTAGLLAGDPVRVAEVLVVATPCPLIIAAPVAFLAGMSRASRSGVIIKDSSSLERLHRTRTVAFDKTGTLTHGSMALVAVRPEEGDGSELLRLAASAEQASTHVLAGAMIAAADAHRLPLSSPEEAEETTGNGVTATIAGTVVAVGKRSFVAAHIGADVAPTPLDAGEMAVYAAIGRRFAGALVFRDDVRAEAGATIDDVRAHGVRHVMMLTGDDRVTADHVAAAVGIDDVRAGCLPSDKVAAIAAVRERPVVMVGDGVNDAPVLAAADVGIAMGARGSTAASDSADIVLLRDDLSCVSRALLIGRETVTVALQSIGIGIALSIALMIVAAVGLLPALVGAWLQEAVDVVSILWALRAVAGARST
ncbi:cadmium-translocating P-type ATPase [Labedella populi]|uniref:Cadmium-translocating P-type ATPase n=1 Tax=Labedella populi TaxID=2498850 RepID=A0A3S4AGD8_9MICO|nr:heavy metal translocating P-type ATPase [Labedella populi]RWZ59208.1 cadmium-translocating P-type ATPase [Labedella populi]